MSRPLLGCSRSSEKQVTNRAKMKFGGDLKRAAVLIVLFTADLAGSKPTPATIPKTGPGGTRVLKFDASDCRYVSVSSVCPGLERKAAMCSWRNVTPSPIPYHQEDDPKYFGHILPVSFLMDTQGWHYTRNASTCGDLLLQERVGSNSDVRRVGCVCWHPAFSVDHLLCAFDMPAKGFHHPRPVEITSNTSVCHASTINALSANTNKANPPLTNSQNQSSIGILPTTNASSDHSGKKDQFRKFEVLVVAFVVFVIIAVVFAIGIAIRCACCGKRCRKVEISVHENAVVLPGGAFEDNPIQTPSSSEACDSAILKESEVQASISLTTDHCPEQLSQKPPREDEDRRDFTLEIMHMRWQHLVNNLRRDDLLNVVLHLLKEKIIDVSEYEEVIAQTDGRGRGRGVEALLRKMLSKKPRHRECFLNFLPVHVPGEGEWDKYDEQGKTDFTNGRQTDTVQVMEGIHSVV